MWADTHQNLLESFASAFPPPTDDESCRAWTETLAEQFAFSFPAEGWGTKQADPGRPPSTDCICTRAPFVGYDVLISQGTPGQTLASYPEGLDLTGQVYIMVTPFDHLNAEPPAPLYPTYEELGGDAGGQKITRQLEADYKRAGLPGLNGDCGAWQQRVSYDFLTGQVSPVEAAIAKHRIDWCAALGVPVDDD